MKIKISKELCSGHGRCWEYAKEVYDLDDNGYSAMRGQIFDVAPGNEKAARLGASNCPEQAIEIIES